MKSAKEILEGYIIDASPFSSGIILAMKEYALAAIKEDRKNLLKHVRMGTEYLEYGYCCWVDKDSILKAPLLKLK